MKCPLCEVDDDDLACLAIHIDAEHGDWGAGLDIDWLNYWRCFCGAMFRYDGDEKSLAPFVEHLKRFENVDLDEHLALGMLARTGK